jgi:hypothetical protein
VTSFARAAGRRTRESYAASPKPVKQAALSLGFGWAIFRRWRTRYRAPDGSPRTVRTAEEARMAALLKESVFGMNILSIAGFVVMGLGLTMRRMNQARLPLCLALMSGGTVLVVLGLFANRLPDF